MEIHKPGQAWGVIAKGLSQESWGSSVSLIGQAHLVAHRCHRYLRHQPKVVDDPVVKLDKSELEGSCYYRKASKSERTRVCQQDSELQCWPPHANSSPHPLSQYHKLGGQG